MKTWYVILMIGLSTTVTAQFTSIQVSTDSAKISYVPLLSLTQGHIIKELNLKVIGENEKRNLEVFRPSLAHTAFFCKIEDKLSKSSKLPVKMRLGDVDYVNQIEGKSRVALAPK